MIEAVNAVVANASVLRGQTEATARALTANPERVQEVAQAPYVSPFIYVDVNFNKAVLQIRDSDTGDVLKQFPSDATLEVRQRIAKQQSLEIDVPEPEVDRPTAQNFVTPAPAPAPAPQNAHAQVAAAALASTAAQAAAVSAPPSSGNVVVTA